MILRYVQVFSRFLIFLLAILFTIEYLRAFRLPNNIYTFSSLTNNRENCAIKHVNKQSQHRPLRIALIKPDAVPGLYHSGYGDENLFIEKASHHWGPIGLFHSEYFTTDYYIIYVNHSDSSTSHWMETSVDCFSETLTQKFGPLPVPVRPREGYSVKGISRTSSINITKDAVDATSVPWQSYDIVMSFSPAVGIDIIEKYPSTIWTYWIIEGCQRTYIQSKKGHLVNGWDFFLTQDFNLFTPLPKNVIEFPLIFDYHGGLFDLYNENQKTRKTYSKRNSKTSNFIPLTRDGILLLPSKLTDEETTILTNISYVNSKNVSKTVPLTKLHGTTPNSMHLHMINKYAVVWNRTSRGNALAEAWSAGLLVMGHVHDRVINNQILSISKCEFIDINMLKKTIIELEKDHDLYLTYVARQRKLFDMLAFYGPVRNLIESGFSILQHKLNRTLPNIIKQKVQHMRRPINIFRSWHL